MAVDTVFHDSEERPFGVFDMLWAHGCPTSALWLRSSGDGARREQVPRAPGVAAFVGAWLCRRTAVATAAPTART